jgi:hypothetical protein
VRRNHLSPDVNRHLALRAVCLLVVTGMLWGCGGASGGKRNGEAGETVYVEGKISLRGSEPFPLILLETADGRFYMIDASPRADELKRLQDMPVGVTGKVLPNVKGDAPALAVEAYDLLPLPSGERPVVGVIVMATPENVAMRAEDDSIWELEGDFKTVFLGLVGAKVWIVGVRELAVNTARANIRSILVTEYGIIREPR